MSLTPLQLRTIHVAARQVGLIDGTDDERYRLLLRNTAGVASAKQLDQRGFEDVMAVMEDLGYAPPGVAMGESFYWRNKVKSRGQRANARQIHLIDQLVGEQNKYPLGALLRRHSNGRTDQVKDLHPREAWNLIEALKAMKKRSGQVVCERSGQVKEERGGPKESGQVAQWPSGQGAEVESGQGMEADDIPF